MTDQATNAATRAAYAGRWDEAHTLLQEAQSESARRQLEVLAGRHPRDLLDPPPPQRISERSAVFVCKGFAPSGFPQWLMESARDRLAPARVNTANAQAVLDPSRTAWVCAIHPDEFNVLTAIIQVRAMRIVGIPLPGHEAPNVIRYQAGQKYDYHHDFIDDSAEVRRQEIRALGQRVTTMVTYLNDDFAGAPTDFPKLGVAFRGDAGDAVAFSNVRADGSPDYDTLHAGLPPTSGEKWVLSQWMRSKPIPAMRPYYEGTKPA